MTPRAPKRKRATAKNVVEVLGRLAEVLDSENDEFNWEARSLVAKRLNVVLDELLAEDTFGTEGQLDPRGDQR